jgi:hypothetical protein
MLRDSHALLIALHAHSHTIWQSCMHRDLHAPMACVTQVTLHYVLTCNKRSSGSQHM